MPVRLFTLRHIVRDLMHWKYYLTFIGRRKKLVNFTPKHSIYHIRLLWQPLPTHFLFGFLTLYFTHIYMNCFVCQIFRRFKKLLHIINWAFHFCIFLPFEHIWLFPLIMNSSKWCTCTCLRHSPMSNTCMSKTLNSVLFFHEWVIVCQLRTKPDTVDSQWVCANCVRYVGWCVGCVWSIAYRA